MIFSLPLHPLAFFFCFYFFFCAFRLLHHAAPRCFSFRTGKSSTAPQGRKKERKRALAREKKNHHESLFVRKTQTHSLFLSISLSLSLAKQTRADVNLTEEKGEREKESSLFLFSSSNSFTRANTHTHARNISTSNSTTTYHSVEIGKRNTLKSRSAAALLSPSIEVDKKVKEE